MDLGKNIQKSVDLYLKNFVTLFLAGLLASLLTGVTLGILAGPLFGGFFILIRKIDRGETGDFNEVFAHFDKLSMTLPLSLGIIGAFVALVIIQTILAFIPVLGWLLIGLIYLVLAVASPAIMMIYFLTIDLIVDKSMSFKDAINAAIKYFMTNPLMNWVYSLVMAILSGILSIFSQPVYSISMAYTSEEINTDSISSNPNASA